MIQLYKMHRGKLILFSLLALLTLYVIIFTELPSLQENDRNFARYKTMSWLLAPHTFFGSIALVLGPFQFSSQLRIKNLALHRNLGKLYIIIILLSVPFAFLINIYYPIPGANNTFAFENITQASVWGTTALMAWVAAAKKTDRASQNVGGTRLRSYSGLCLIKDI
ncbi:DUF2306 domain-containing protein [Flavihumibacter fluvii]|uniref:DUF2306 domain-containing protein n=1 Tax=Flavihumibacter fluvii TaxID=2838157 RepID=UPI001BDE4BB8|nr:DUF2306 domain-containing protein [Flavihumibacter fluvii]ULQ54666.1 DUF2306 domain-containing protein [Flavihumibacter fluvii]